MIPAACRHILARGLSAAASAPASALVVAEGGASAATRTAVAAAGAAGLGAARVDGLVMGGDAGAEGDASAAAKLPGVDKVRRARA